MRQKLHDHLYEFQRDGVAAALANPRFLILDPPGLGKTKQALGVIDTLLQEGRLGRVLVAVEGTTLASQWAGVLHEWLPDLPVTLADATAKGRKALDAFAGSEGPAVVIATYDLVHTRREDPWVQSPWSLMVMDEVSALKGAKVRQESAREVGRRAQRVLGLTATELENAGTDTWAILDVVGTPGLWPSDYFDEQFIEWSDPYPLHGEEVPAKAIGLRHENLDELRDYLRRYSVRRTEEQAGVVMPTRIGDDVIWVQPTSEQAWWLRKDDEKRAGIFRTKMWEVHSACAGFKGRNVLPTSGKALAAVQWIERHPEHRKILVYAHNLEHLDVIERLLGARGIGHVRIEGKTPKDERADAVQEFTDDPSVRVFVGSRVLERGLDGLQGASALLTLGCSDNPAREEQREGRVRRMGSPNTTYEHVTFMLDHRYDHKKWLDVASKRDQQQALRATG